jgi:putative transposase
MPNFIRAKQPGGTFFFTVVTHKRRQLFNEMKNCSILRQAIFEVGAAFQFNIDAWVLLPEHLHCIWTLPEDDSDFSKRWGIIKAKFSKRAQLGQVWQNRFWEHLVRDDRDMGAHLDYIHYNPVKHGLAASPADWPFSTFHRFVRAGLYPADWGEGIKFDSTDKFGE